MKKTLSILKILFLCTFGIPIMFILFIVLFPLTFELFS